MTTAVATHALYRFFDGADELLYVGLTVNPAVRFNDHRSEKPWWTEVVRITIETHPSREAVAAAERAAIIAEKPRYNVQHNGGRSALVGHVAQQAPSERIRFGLEVDFIVALMVDIPTASKCYVGLVEAVDDLGVRITLFDWLIGSFCQEDLFVPWTRVLGAAVWTEQHSIVPGALESWQNRVRRHLDPDWKPE